MNNILRSFMCEANKSIISTYRYIGSSVIGTLSIFAILTPVLMILLPKMDVVGFKESQMICNVECDGLLISFSFKLVILTIGTWALFFRPSKVMKCIDTIMYDTHVNYFTFWHGILINISLYISGYLTSHIHVSIMHLRVVIRDCICILVILWRSGSGWSWWRGPSYDKCSPSKSSVHRCSELCVKHG